MKKASKLQIAKSYAQALYDAAEDHRQIEKTFQECTLIQQTFSDMVQIRQLKNPAWTFEQKKEIVRSITQQLHLSDVSHNFLLTVAQNGRFDDICRIAEEFKHIFYQKQNIKEVTVESTQELSASQSKKLTEGLESRLGQKVVLNYVIKPEILGGLIVRTGSTQIDDSLLGKLNRLEQVMKGK